MVVTRSGRESSSGDPPKRRTAGRRRRRPAAASEKRREEEEEDRAAAAAEDEEAKSLMKDEIHDSPPKKKRKVLDQEKEEEEEEEGKRKNATRISFEEDDVSFDLPFSFGTPMKSPREKEEDKKEQPKKAPARVAFADSVTQTASTETVEAEPEAEEIKDEVRDSKPKLPKPTVSIMTPTSEKEEPEDASDVTRTPEKQVMKEPPSSVMRTYPRSILTPGRHISPKNRPMEPPGTARKSVCFHSVVVREFERLHDGSGGVPVDGAYPLGLGWNHADDVQKPVSVYEVERTPKRMKDVMPLTEPQRKALLQRLDDTLAEDGAEREVRRVESEIYALQKSRLLTPGCRCRGNSCVMGSCPCYAAGLPCLESYCHCKHCLNPYVSEDQTDPKLLALAQQQQKRYAEIAALDQKQSASTSDVNDKDTEMKDDSDDDDDDSDE